MLMMQYDSLKMVQSTTTVTQERKATVKMTAQKQPLL